MKKSNRIGALIGVILASLGVAIIITGALFHFEGMYAEKHDQLIIVSRQISGGEWMAEKGLFWTIGKTAPLSDGIHQEPSRTTLSSDISAAFYLIPLLWVVLSFVIALIAKIPFKKIIKTLGIELLLSLVVVVSIRFCQGSKIFEPLRNKLIDRTSITDMKVYTNALNNDDTVGFYFPYVIYKYDPTGENGEPAIDYIKLSEDVSQNISASDIKKLLAIIDKIKTDPTVSEDGEYSYYIELSYIDKDNHSSVIIVRGSGGFPECWPDFVRMVNKICDYDCLVEYPTLFDDPSCNLQTVFSKREKWYFY